jgi:aspartyl protease family protein
MRTRTTTILFAIALATAALSAAAQNGEPGRRVAFSGSMGDKALLVIDGQPRMLAPGAAHQGVKLIGVNNGEAQLEVDGRRMLLRIGAEQVSLGSGPRPGAGSQIVLTAGLGGHFTTVGSINGRSVELLVDTGATTVAMSQADADRIGLDYRNGKRGMAMTANGPVPANRVMLNVVRVGDVDIYNVEALVVPGQMSHILLGNSYLTRFQMKRENDTLTWSKRP